MSGQNPASDPAPAGTNVVEAERRFFARRQRGETVVISGQLRPLGWFQRSFETTITFGILLLVALSTANSIYIAGWVAEMPDLRITAAIGIVLAMALGAIRRLRWPLGILLGFVLGGVLIMGQMVQLESLGGQPVFWDRFTDFAYRFEDWFRQAFSAGLTTDNLPFVFFTDVFIFIAAFLGSYAVVRWRNAWVAIILLGALLAVNVSYLSDRQWNLSYGFFLTGSMLLLMRSSLLRRFDNWRASGAAYPDWISLSFLGATLIAIILLLSLSRALPRPDESQALEDAWSAIANPFEGLSDDFRRVFSGIDSHRGAPVHSFDDFMVLQGDVDPGDAIIMRAAATEPGLLRGASYDRYTGRGWIQSPSSSRTVPELEPISGEAAEDAGSTGGGVVITRYLERRPVAAQISVERSPGVLFSFGVPVIANKATRVDSLAPAEFTVDFSEAERFSGTDLEPAVTAIVERLAQTSEENEISLPSAAEVASYVPPQYYLVDVVTDEVDGAPTALVLRSEPEEADILALRPTQKRVRAGFTYQITGTVSGANELALSEAGYDYPLWVRETFLQLPDFSEDDQVRLQQLLDTIAARFALPRDIDHPDRGYNAYAIATAIEAYLRSAPALDERGQLILDDDGNAIPLYPLTTDIDLPPADADAVLWFLFENTEDGRPIGGYYDYHASSMAILLRVAGVPARIATGFVLSSNNFDERTENYIVRGHDAYTWVEVYFPDYGWVDFDPTPGSSIDEALASIAGGGAGGRRIAAQRLSTPRLDLRPGFGGDVMQDIVLEDLLQYLAQGVIPGEDLAIAGPPSKWYWLGPTIGAAILAGAIIVFALAWRVSLRGLGPAERAWVSTARLARWSGVPAGDSTTAQEHATRIDEALGTEDRARSVARAYAAVRFGRKQLSEADDVSVAQTWRTLRGRLVRRMLHLPGGRPKPPEAVVEEVEGAAPAPAGD